MRTLLLELDTAPGLGRRASVEQALRRAIRSGQLHEGTRLPSTRTLAHDLGLARATVVAAYDQLVAEGYLIASHGSGTSVGSAHQSKQAPRRRSGGPGSLRLDFVPGEPDQSSFPRRAWLSAVSEALKVGPDELFGYGDRRGRHELRSSLTEYLSRTRAVAIEPERVSIFSGFTNALFFLAETFRRSGIDRIGMEDPGLPLHAHLLSDAGLQVVPIPVDDDGISVEHLEAKQLKAVLVTPAHEYPLGMAMSPHRRALLLTWARRNSAWIVEDDYDGEFRYDRQPIGALQGLGSDRVIYAGTLSKSLAPGLRIGWLVLPTGLVDAIAEVKGRGQQPRHRQPITQPPGQKPPNALRGRKTDAQKGQIAKAQARQHGKQDDRRGRMHQIFPRTLSSHPAKPVALMSSNGASRLAFCGESFFRGGRYLLVGRVPRSGIRS